MMLPNIHIAAFGRSISLSEPSFVSAWLGMLWIGSTQPLLLAMHSTALRYIVLDKLSTVSGTWLALATFYVILNIDFSFCRIVYAQS